MDKQDNTVILTPNNNVGGGGRIGDSRIPQIDIAKGICIFLMVLGHSTIPKFADDFIHAFHMPFFFFISGVTTNFTTDITKFVKKKTLFLMLPFAIYGLLIAPIYSYSLTGAVLSKEYIINLITVGSNCALWFIPILWLGGIICRLISEKYIITFAFILAAISSWLDLKGIVLPWCMSTLPIATSFVLLGRFYSQGIKDVCRMSQNRLPLTALTIVVSFIAIVGISHVFQLHMHENEVNPTIILICGALFGCAFLISLSSAICLPLFGRNHNWIAQWLTYTGKNTFVFVGLSQAIIKAQNLFYKDNVILKYAILFILLYAFAYLKNNVKVLSKLHL